MDALEAIRTALASDQFDCPGAHRLDGRRGDLDDVMMDLMEERELPEEWGEDDLYRENPQLYRRLKDEGIKRWVVRGECTKTLTIEMEYDGDEYQTFCYPVARSDCAAALGIDEDEDYSHPIWSVFFERRRLAKILSQAERAIPDLEPVS